MKTCSKGKFMFSKSTALTIVCLAFLLFSVTSAGGGAPSYFQPVQNYGSQGWNAVSIAVADVNGDGELDLLVANQCVNDDNCSLQPFGIGRGGVGVILGNGDGTFQPAHAYLSGGYAATSIAVADVNGDGKLDLVVAHECGDSDCSGRGVLGVLLGNGDGTFQPAVTFGSGGYEAMSLAVGDFNGDGKADIAVANQLLQKHRFDKGDTLVGVLLGNGDGTFQTARMYNSGDADSALSIVAADVNKDGKLDLVVGHGDANFQSRSTVGVLLGNGDGTFQTAQRYSSGGFHATSIVVEDINGDGKVDLLVANLGLRENNWTRGVVTVRLGNGDGTFAAAHFISTSTGWPSSIAVTDVNRDGKPDLLVKDSLGLRTWLGNGDGTFRLPGNPGTSPTAGLSIAAADVNHDGRPDVLVALGCVGVPENCTLGAGVLLNAVPFATTTELSSNLKPAVYGQAVTLKATVTPSGLYALTGKVRFMDGTTGIGSATLSGGVATLTKSKLVVGTHSITATYGGDTFNGNSVSAAITQTVSQASVSMVLTSIPNPSNFGKSVHFTATLTSTGSMPSWQPVTFSYNGATLGTANVGGTGVATFSTTTLPQGSDAVTAAYAGNVDYSSASATVTQVVN
jgi:hypothetical protein